MKNEQPTKKSEHLVNLGYFHCEGLENHVLLHGLNIMCGLFYINMQYYFLRDISLLHNGLVVLRFTFTVKDLLKT